jgi:hypothetical protein
MRWGGGTAHIRNAYKILVSKCEGNEPLKRPRIELDSSGSGYEPVAGSCEQGNKPSGSIKGGNFLTS